MLAIQLQVHDYLMNDYFLLRRFEKKSSDYGLPPIGYVKDLNLEKMQNHNLDVII